MKFVISIVVLLLHVSHAMAYGKIFPTRFPMNPIPGTSRLTVKKVSELPEFKNLVFEVDDTLRNLELREGIAKAKEKYKPGFTFRCMCGTTYSSVFGTK